MPIERALLQIHMECSHWHFSITILKAGGREQEERKKHDQFGNKNAQ